MKKVLLSAYACLPNHGSEEGNGWNYATLLSESGYEIHCLTQHQAEAAIEPNLTGGSFPNLKVHYVPVPNWVDQFYHKGLVGMYFHYLYWQWQAYQLARHLDLVYRICRQLAYEDYGSPKGAFFPNGRPRFAHEDHPGFMADWPFERPSWWLPPPGMLETMAAQPTNRPSKTATRTGFPAPPPCILPGKTA